MKNGLENKLLKICRYLKCNNLLLESVFLKMSGESLLYYFIKMKMKTCYIIRKVYMHNTTSPPDQNFDA